MCCNIPPQKYKIFLPRLRLLSFMFLRLLLSELLLNHNPQSQFKSIPQNPPIPQVSQLYLDAAPVLAQSVCYKYFFHALDIPVESPSFSHTEPSRVSERIILLNNVMLDSSDSEIITIKAQRPDKKPSSPPTVQFACLSQLDAQLAALQNIADNLEMEFSNSRMVHRHVLIFF